MKKIFTSPEVIGILIVALALMGCWFTRDTNKPVPAVSFYSPYEWNYSQAQDSAVISQIFGYDSEHMHAIIHCRTLDTSDIYINLHEQLYITPGHQYSVELNGLYYPCKYFKKNTLQVTRKANTAYESMCAMDSITLSIIKDGRVCDTYKFKPIRRLHYVIY